jgi:hypothetical protein
MSAPTSGARLPAAETRSASVAHSKLRRREHHTRMPAIRPGAAILRMELLCHEASGTDDPGRHDCILARPAQSAQRLGQGLHSGAGFLTGLATERWTLSASDEKRIRLGKRQMALPLRPGPRRHRIPATYVPRMAPLINDLPHYPRRRAHLLATSTTLRENGRSFFRCASCHRFVALALLREATCRFPISGAPTAVGTSQGAPRVSRGELRMAARLTVGVARTVAPPRSLLR